MNFTSKKTARDFRADARTALKGHWGIAVLVSFLASILGATSGNAGAVFADINRHSLAEIYATLTQHRGDFAAADILSLLQQLMHLLVPMLAEAFAMGLALYLIGGCIKLGLCRFRLALLDGEKTSVGILFSGFNNMFFKALGLRFLCDLFIFLWTLLLTIPLTGILSVFLLSAGNELPEGPIATLIALPCFLVLVFLVAGIILAISLRYSMAYYALAENPNMTAMDAIRESCRMMKGNKWRLFCLQISFLGWAMLCALSAGIGCLWYIPYVGQAEAAFYHEISGRAAVRQAVSELDAFMQDI